MTTYRLAPLKAAAIRITRLDSCGMPDTGACAMFASKNLVSIEQTGELTDEVEFPLVNADGDLEEYSTDPGRLKYLALDIMVTKAIPELMEWMTGSDVITDDAATPSSIGWRTQVNASGLSNFALEIWTRLAGASSCPGSSVYGYGLWPWLYNGSMYAIKHENGLSELKISAKSKTGSPWSLGPYSVNLSKAVATLDQPMALFEAVSATEDHSLFQRTELSPPLMSVDCGPVVGAMAVVDDDAAGAGLAATATIPLPVADNTPGYIDWGDATAPDPVVAGALTATHVYAAAGPYTVTYLPSAHSSVVFTGSVTMA